MEGAQKGQAFLRDFLHFINCFSWFGSANFDFRPMFQANIIIPPYTGFLGHASASLARQEEMVNENILLDTQAATLKGALQCSLDTHTHWVPSNVQLHVKLLNSVPEFSANCVRQPHQLN
eukprot:scaffold58268_cov14-Tisochrysis_lutea.AAC.1